MRRKGLFILEFIFLSIMSYASDIDVSISVPEDYGIDFPTALHLDRLYFAMENEKGELELLTEADINVGVAYQPFGSVDLCLLYYGNLSQPYVVQLVIDADDGFLLENAEPGTFVIPISPVISLPQLTGGLATSDVLLSAEENKADLIVNPVGPVQGERVVDIALNWNGGRDLLPGVYTADISMMLISE